MKGKEIRIRKNVERPQKAVTLLQILIIQNDSLLLPEPLKEVRSEVIQYFPEYEYSLWGDSQIRDFLESEFDPEVYKAYCSLVPFTSFHHTAIFGKRIIIRTEGLGTLW